MNRLTSIAVSLIMLGSVAARAEVSKMINTSEMNAGWMNVFDTSWNYLWGSGWGVSDLSVIYHDTHTISFRPCPMGDPDPYWYVGGGGPGALGNKIMQANWYNDTQGLHGQTITFAGIVVSNTLVTGGATGYTVVAFIKDFAPDYSSWVGAEVDLTATNSGTFSISFTTINNPARHQQWGLQMNGRNVWPTDLPSKGVITVTQIPEPAMLGVAIAAAVGILRRRG